MIELYRERELLYNYYYNYYKREPATRETTHDFRIVVGFVSLWCLLMTTNEEGSRRCRTYCVCTLSGTTKWIFVSRHMLQSRVHCASILFVRLFVSSWISRLNQFVGGGQYQSSISRKILWIQHRQTSWDAGVFTDIYIYPMIGGKGSHSRECQHCVFFSCHFVPSRQSILT